MFLDTLVPQSPLVEGAVIAVPILAASVGGVIHVIGRRADRLDKSIADLASEQTSIKIDVAYIKGQLASKPRRTTRTVSTGTS